MREVEPITATSEAAPCDRCNLAGACAALNTACERFAYYVEHGRARGTVAPDHYTYLTIFDPDRAMVMQKVETAKRRAAKKISEERRKRAEAIARAKAMAAQYQQPAQFTRA